MIWQSDEEVNMRRYLLGDVDEQRREQLEERVLCDRAFAERLSIAEAHLIDDYIFGGLSEAERQSFEKNFILNEERRNSLRVAQALEVYVTKKFPPQPAANQFTQLASDLWRSAALFIHRHKVWATLAFAMILFVVLFGPGLVRWLAPRTISPSAPQRARIERELAELNRDPSRVVNSATIDLALQPTLLREGGETKRVALTSHIQFVRLKLEFPQVKYDRYRCLVLTVEGDELFAVADLKPEADTGVGVILLWIPSNFLSNGDYQIELQGISGDSPAVPVAHYNFRIAGNGLTR